MLILSAKVQRFIQISDAGNFEILNELPIIHFQSFQPLKVLHSNLIAYALIFFNFTITQNSKSDNLTIKKQTYLPSREQFTIIYIL